MVSVIIPIYNVEKYLRECVDSVIRQTYADLEIILVDDGSPDHCGAICDEYALIDERVVVIHKENGGLSDARNAGFAEAHGEYVYFLDSDDALKQDAIEHLVKRIEEESAEMIFFDAETIYEDFEDQNYQEEIKRKNVYNTDVGASVWKALLDNAEFWSCVPLHFFRSDFLKQNKLSFEKGMMHEDELFTAMTYVRAKRVAQERTVLYCRRLRANSIMSQKNSEKSVSGLIGCVEGLLNERTKYKEECIAKTVLSEYTCLLSTRVINQYALFENHERKRIKPLINRMKQMLRGVGCLGNNKLKVKLAFFPLFVFYKRHLSWR